MKITHHKDGTFSLTELTGSDLANLQFGASSATAFNAQRAETPEGRGEGWHDRQWQMYDRLYHALSVRGYDENDKAILAHGRSKVVQSQDWSDNYDNAYMEIME